MSTSGQKNLKISVVIPSYNRGKLIRRAVESALHQTKRPHEVIVVDDGSRDDTREQVASFGGAIRYLYQDNAGASNARNRGVVEASADWVAFLDSDDLWLETHLERMENAIAGTGGSGVYYFADMQQAALDGGGSLWDLSGFKITGDYELTDDATSWAMMERQPMMLQTSVFHKQRYLAGGGLWEPLRTRHDTHLFLKLGIGRPACAVSGFGALRTSDDDTGIRLMSAFGDTTLSFWLETIPLYEDIIEGAPQLDEPHMRLLRARLAEAHWRVSRFSWKERNISSSLWHAAKSFTVEPRTILRTLSHPLRLSPGMKAR